jgi:nicotinamidase-related amidase
MGSGLNRGPLPPETFNLCVDMQNLFADASPWAVPSLKTILSSVLRLAERKPEKTIFTRFITPERPDDSVGSWRRVYEAWPQVTRLRLAPGQLDLIPELGWLVPPARVFNKERYSPWYDGKLARFLQESRAEALVVTGGETDVCVLATVLGAIDAGFRVILASDAVCSVSDETHDALLDLYTKRFSHRLETASTEEILESWQ